MKTYLKMVSMIFAFHILAEVAIPECNGLITKWSDFLTPCGWTILVHAGLQFPCNLIFRNWEPTGILWLFEFLALNALVFSILTGSAITLYRKLKTRASGNPLT